MQNLICKNCGKSFTSKRKHQQFCCKGCATSYRQKVHDLDFMKHDCEFKYYMIGLLHADGSVSKQNGKQERITLELIDRDIIERAKPLMSPDRKLYVSNGIKSTHKATYKIINTNPEAIAALKLFGFVGKKTTDRFFPQLSNEDFKHFMRGYFDGDGSVYYNTVNGCIYKHISITFSNMNFANSCLERLLDFGFEFHLNKDSRVDHKAIYLKLYKKDEVRRFADWLYLDATWFLQRKYNTFYNEIV